MTTAESAPHFAGGHLTGTVTDFDAEVGWGVVSSEGADYPFHSTAIADGTRLIDVATAVAFEVVPGRMGRWEGSALRAL
ncbi:MAG: hypothetical protein RIE08_16965 [Acidimicrobiales bacterium]